MAKETLTEANIEDVLRAVSHLVHLPTARMWLDYDESADVLYVHFTPEPSSTHSDMRDDRIILDYTGKQLVGLTVLDASTR